MGRIIPDELQRLTIGRWDFELACEYDTDSAFDYPQLTYLDQGTGEVIWVYKKDKDAEDEANMPPEENREVRERIKKERKRYLKIPCKTQSDDHEMMREFLRSNWTENVSLWERTIDAYTGSIKRWKRAVSGDTVRAFKEFENDYVKIVAERFLRENGIEPEWKQ